MAGSRDGGSDDRQRNSRTQPVRRLQQPGLRPRGRPVGGRGGDDERRLGAAAPRPGGIEAVEQVLGRGLSRRARHRGPRRRRRPLRRGRVHRSRHPHGHADEPGRLDPRHGPVGDVAALRRARAPRRQGVVPAAILRHRGDDGPARADRRAGPGRTPAGTSAHFHQTTGTCPSRASRPRDGLRGGLPSGGLPTSGYQPRSRHCGSDGRSAPRVVSAPCPG